MQVSQAGLDFIKSFEGYHRKLPNGDCTGGMNANLIR